MRVSEELVRHPDRSFRFLRFEADAFRGERHRHRQIELTWIEAGVGMRFVGDAVEPFAADDIVLLGSNVAHSWVSSKRGAPKWVAATVIQFAPELLALPAFPELARALPLAARATRGLRIEGQCRAEVVPLLKRMRSEGDIGQLACLIEVLARLSTHEHSFRPIATSPLRGAVPTAREQPESRRIDQALDWIHRHFSRELTVEAAARIAHVTPGAFSRFFHREVGKTFTRYVNDVRCGEACLKLRLSDRPVATIARECGFDTLSHFNRQFRLRHGMTPREFRRHA